MTEGSGVLQMVKGGGMLRQVKASFSPRPNDAFVPDSLIRRHQLVPGSTVCGPVERVNGRLTLKAVDSVCGMAPEDFAGRRKFEELTVIDPLDRFHLASSGLMTMRVMDLVAPVGKGTRALVVSPPKAGKTTYLRDFAKAVRAEDPNIRVIVLLIDERPEEVTEFRRHVDGEVMASNLDQSAGEHVALAELVHDHVRCELECGRNVVLIIDSLTRMARAFNVQPRRSRDHNGRGGGGIMSGGLAAGVLEIPRRIFGLARNIEGGGSVTVLASILVDTGSRMDQVIFEEFKGTGNSELVLDRRLAELRIFPAVDIPRSGTRREEKLIGPSELKATHALRRMLAASSTQEATRLLINRLEKFKTNEDFIRQITPA